MKRRSVRQVGLTLALAAIVTGCATPDVEWKNDGSKWRKKPGSGWQEVTPPPQLPPPPAGSSSWQNYSNSVGGQTSNSTTPPPTGYASWDAWNSSPSVSPPSGFSSWENWMITF